MVSPTTPTDVPSSVTKHDRGFVPEETFVVSGLGSGATTMYYRPFWWPVIAGTLFVYSVFVLSWYLMLGFTVGVHQDMLALGGGAAIWIWVTSCVAYFFGGMIASSMSMPNGARSLKGAAIWGLSIPLALVVYAFAAQSPVMAGLELPHVGVIERANAVTGTVSPISFAWCAFITIALGLIFSIVGSYVGCACHKDSRSSMPSI